MSRFHNAAQLVIGPLKPGDGQLTIDYAKAAKALSAIVGLVFGWKGLPSAISNLPDALKAIYREIPADKKAQAQGFTLYLTGLSSAISTLCEEYAPDLLASEETKEEWPSLILGALNREELKIDHRFFRSPALNPGFVRVKERLLTVLEQPAVDLADDAIDAIGNKLGGRFSAALADLVQTLQGRAEFKDFLSYFEDNPFNTALARGWLWDDYRSAVNRKVYQRLFLHEMEGHPDIGLADVYVPSRAIYKVRPVVTRERSSTESTRIHAMDLAGHLSKEWLLKSPSKVGLARLLTGDPGSGKSTFSLMFAQELLQKGWRALVIPANSIRSLELSLKDILATHLMHSLRLDLPPNIEAELLDPESTGKPLLIILDGLDEYDVAGMTVSMSAALLTEHALQVVQEWAGNLYNVRLLLCGRPEAAAGLSARFRDVGHHLHVTGFLAEDRKHNEVPADSKSEEILAVDQRENWWRNWQACLGDKSEGLPRPIRDSKDAGVREITSQPLLNYMLAVLRLYDEASLTNPSALYGELFSRYYERQAKGKSATFETLCPTLDRFKRIMSEIGIAAWHAGDRSVSVEDLRIRFNRPPLKNWFEQADRSHNSGLGAILSAFYTRPEDAASPHSGLAERYVFTHKSFREYLTAVGLARFLERLAEYLNPDAEDGWSDTQALGEWLALFGPTAMDERQWEFLQTELQLTFRDSPQLVAPVKQTVERMFEFALLRRMPSPSESTSQELNILRCGNAEEAMLLILSAIREAIIRQAYFDRSEDTKISIDWDGVSMAGASLDDANELREFMNRLRSRPGSPDTIALHHLYCLFEKGSLGLNRQVQTQFRKRPDGWEFASIFDLSGAKLNRACLHGVGLRYGRLHRTEVAGASFSNATLMGADLSYLSSSRGELDTSPLVDFTGADLDRATLNHAELPLALFDGASMRDVSVMHIEADSRAFEHARFFPLRELDKSEDEEIS